MLKDFQVHWTELVIMGLGTLGVCANLFFMNEYAHYLALTWVSVLFIYGWIRSELTPSNTYNYQ